MKYGDYVRVKKTGEIGVVSTQTKDRVSVVFEDIEKRYLKSSVEVIEKTHLSENNLRNIFRLNIAYMDMYEDIRLVGNYDFEKPYKPNIDDLLAMLMNLKIREISVGQFMSALFEINVILQPCYVPQDSQSEDNLESTLLMKESDVFEYILTSLDANNLDPEDLMCERFDLDEFITIASLFKKNIGKPLLEREYTDVIKDNFLWAIYDNDSFGEINDEYAKLFKKFVEELVAKGDGEAMEILGYCYYGGNKLYPCDWEKSRDLFEKHYAEFGNPEIANSLGYIYYAGRCNNDVGEYEKAFKYFSIGAAAGLYESKYKLADMFRRGHYVTRNYRVAEDIYNELYEENLKVFSKGFFDCKLADIALRLGTLYLERNQYTEAYYFLLEADFAIRKRMANYNYYGDQSVFDSITEALESCKRNQKFETQKYAIMGTLDILKLFFDGHHRLYVRVKELSGHKVKLTFTRQPFRDEYADLCLMSLISFNGCLLTDTLTVTALNVDYSKYAYGFYATSMEYDQGYVRFYDQDENTYTISCESFRVDNPIKEYPKDEYRFIQVKVEDKILEYQCEDIYVYAGERVLVEVDGKPQKGMVTKSYVRNLQILEKPVEQYQGFIRKTEF